MAHKWGAPLSQWLQIVCVSFYHAHTLLANCLVGSAKKPVAQDHNQTPRAKRRSTHWHC